MFLNEAAHYSLFSSFYIKGLGFFGLFSKFSCHLEDRFWLLGSIIINVISNSLSRFLKSWVFSFFAFYYLKPKNATAPEVLSSPWFAYCSLSPFMVDAAYFSHCMRSEKEFKHLFSQSSAVKLHSPYK